MRKRGIFHRIRVGGGGGRCLRCLRLSSGKLRSAKREENSDSCWYSDWWGGGGGGCWDDTAEEIAPVSPPPTEIGRKAQASGACSKCGGCEATPHPPPPWKKAVGFEVERGASRRTRGQGSISGITVRWRMRQAREGHSFSRPFRRTPVAVRWIR